MADRPISALTQATQIKNEDCFVLQQDTEAKKLQGSSLIQYINQNSAISSITQGATDTDGTTHFTATFGGGQTFNYTLPSGKDIYLDGNPVVSYAKASSLSSTPPSSGWQSTLSALGTIKGYYVWTRYYIKYNTGQQEYHYDVVYQGLDGNGTINSVNGISPSGSSTSITIYGNNINMTSSDSTTLSTAIEKREVYVLTTGNFSALPFTYPTSGTDSKIESDMVVVKSYLSTPSAQGSDWTVSTASGSLTITGTYSGTTETNITLFLEKSR